MKILLTLFLIVGLLFNTYGQDAAEKKILAGLTIGGDINLNSPETNTIDSKVGGDFIVGMALDWNFTKNIGLSTGLEFDFNRFKTSYNDTLYFDYNDKEILQQKDLESTNSEHLFWVNKRQHKSIYLTLPVMLKFQTNFMGYMRYYGKFGVRNSFLLTTRTNNEGQGYTDQNTPEDISELDDMKSPGVMSFYKGSIGIAGGAEYNITGNTVLVAEIGYYFGFSEVFQQKGALFGDDEKGLSLYRYEEGSTERSYYAPSLKQSQLTLKVSVLF